MSFGDDIVEIARLFLGKGEAVQNNDGLWVNIFRKGWRVYGGGEWCAHFAATCVELAFYGNELKPPRVRSRGARKFWRNCRKHGRELGWCEDPQPGDIELRNRPGPGMHVGIVVSYSRVDHSRMTIEGNVGRFPAKVKELHRGNHKLDDAHVGFVRLGEAE